MAQLRDTSGTVVFEGTIEDFVAGIPQGGPLTEDLLTGGFALKGADAGPVVGGRVRALAAGGAGGECKVEAGAGAGFVPGGNATLTAGDNGPRIGGQVSASGATNADSGRVAVSTRGVGGQSGQALVSDGAGALIYGGVSVGAGVPGGAPAGSLPFAFDTTPVSGGFYFWNGAAWVKIAAIL